MTLKRCLEVTRNRGVWKWPKSGVWKWPWYRSSAQIYSFLGREPKQTFTKSTVKQCLGRAQILYIDFIFFILMLPPISHLTRNTSSCQPPKMSILSGSIFTCRACETTVTKSTVSALPAQMESGDILGLCHLAFTQNAEAIFKPLKINGWNLKITVLFETFCLGVGSTLKFSWSTIVVGG